MNKRRTHKKEMIAVLGRSLDPGAANTRKTLHILMGKPFVSNKKLHMWHNVMNNSISRHSSNSHNTLIGIDLAKQISTLENCEGVVYCTGRGCPRFYPFWNTLEKLFLNSLLSQTKREDKELQTKYKTPH